MDKEEILQLLKPKSTITARATFFLVLLVAAMLFAVLWVLVPPIVVFIYGYTTVILTVAFVLAEAINKKDK